VIISLYPDFSYFDSNDLDTAKVRELLSGLAVKPFFGKKKVCVIDSIEAMSSQSANSLLKTIGNRCLYCN
jgi:DNA polymerase III gamma/tau subunit